MKSEMLKGHLDPLLLAILESAPSHGYAIIEELRQRSGGEFDLPEGTVYPALYRLERDRFVSSATSDVNGRKRRVYRLTARGSRALSARRTEWTQFSSAVSVVLASPA